MPHRAAAVAALTLLASAALAGPALGGAVTRKKAIWGPLSYNGKSQFPIYRRLGAGIYEMNLNWAEVAPTRPIIPRDPIDPAYNWPTDIDRAIDEGAKNGIRVSLLVMRTPPWANNQRTADWAPSRPGDYADFLEAAARRYPKVRHWMVWGEPCRHQNWQPLTPQPRPRRFSSRTKPKPLTRKQAQAPQAYARLLDAAYVRLKRVTNKSKNVVIGGNTWTFCEISPESWIKYMRLPHGKVPRMDLYGHNPFTSRRPNLRNPPTGAGYYDFSDLGRLAKLLDRYLPQPRHRRLGLFLSEFFLATRSPNKSGFNHESNFYVGDRTQASWLSSGLKIVRKYKNIYTLGWLSLYDDPPRPAGDQVMRGLLRRDGTPKRAYYSFKNG